MKHENKKYLLSSVNIHEITQISSSLLIAVLKKICAYKNDL